MTRRKSISAKERAHLFQLHGGICHICKGKIQVGEAWEVEHVIPWEISRDDSDKNRKPAHEKCHREQKTPKDRKDIAKVKRQEAKHRGYRKAKRPFPGSKRDRWKKRLDGTVVPR